jgi:anaerobic ribonucleoside-triphosphate reductase activating protein
MCDYTYEQIKEEGGAKWDFLCILDVLIDGPFILEERDIALRFHGSKNQPFLCLHKEEIENIE